MNLFDKKGALMYILKVASAKNISQAKLIDGIYDYSHFNRMCNGKEPIKLEVLVFCAKKLSIDLNKLLELGEYDDIELKGNDRDAVSIVKNDQRFLFPECKVLSVTYTTFSENDTFLSLNKKEVLELIDLIEESPILKDGDSLSNYGVKDDTQEKYAKICIVYKNSRGEVQNVWLNTFKGDVLHFYDSSGEDYRIGPNKKLVEFITNRVGYRVLSTTDFDKIERIVVKYNNEEYQLSAKKTEQFIKAVKKLDKRQDEFHDYNLTALAYTSDGDVYHIKTDERE